MYVWKSGCAVSSSYCSSGTAFVMLHRLQTAHSNKTVTKMHCGETSISSMGTGCFADGNGYLSNILATHHANYTFLDVSCNWYYFDIQFKGKGWSVECEWDVSGYV